VAVAATAVLAYGGTTGWVSEPCKRDDVAFKLDRVPFMKRNYEQNCLVVNRTRNSLSSRATGAYAELAKWVKEQGGGVPIPVLVDATITRIAAVEYLVVRYAFNPDAYGCDPRDPAKDSFVEAVIEVGKALQTGVSEGFSGRTAGPT